MNAPPPGAARPFDWIMADICRHMAAEIDELEAALERDGRGREELAERAAELRREHARRRRRADGWGWLPLLGSRLRRQAAGLARELGALKGRMDAMRRAEDGRRRALVKAHLLYEMLILLSQRDYCVPDPAPLRSRRFMLRFEAARKSETVRRDVHALAEELSDILGEWAAASLLHLERQRREGEAGAGRTRHAESGTIEPALVFDRTTGRYVETAIGQVRGTARLVASHRIYLPVPRAWEARLARAGARIDDSTVDHVMSRLWVGFDDYERFEEYLPRAYRRAPPELDFTFAPPSFGGHEFRLAPSQSRPLLAELGEAQGWRCVLCGSHGGLVWDRLRMAAGRGPEGPLALRPLWMAHRLDGHAGVATIVEMLLICRDCDLAFGGGGFETLLGAADGGLAEKARAHVRRRRMMLLRCDEVTLAHREAALRAERAGFDGIRRWVLDLSVLAARHAALGTGVVLPEDMPVAGAAIVSEAGEPVLPARSVEEVLAGVGAAEERPPSPAIGDAGAARHEARLADEPRSREAAVRPWPG